MPIKYSRDDIDKYVDYKALFGAMNLSKVTYTGSQMQCCCPIHNDASPSFSASMRTGQCHCFACNWSGNYFSLVATLEGISTVEVYERVEKAYELESSPRRYYDGPFPYAGKTEANSAPVVAAKAAPTGQPPAEYKLDEYAESKRLPTDWLRSECKMGRGGYSKKYMGPYLEIPYLDEHGDVIYCRNRMYPGSQTRFYYGRNWNKYTGPKIYGLHRLLKDVDTTGYLIICEGESDTQSLWMMGEPAIGIPGSNMFGAREAAKIVATGVQDVRVHKDHDDRGGAEFCKNVTLALADAGYTGKITVWECWTEQEKSKDPSDVWVAHCDAGDARAIIDRAMAAGEQVTAEMYAKAAIGGLTDPPYNANVPDWYKIDDSGIWRYDTKLKDYVLVSAIPFIPSKRLIAKDEEMVEIAWRKDGEWKYAQYPRSTVRSYHMILQLSDRGMDISSKNAKECVAWVAAWEAANINTMPRQRVVNHCGWMDNKGKEFWPYAAADVKVLSADGLESIAAGMKQVGSLDVWLMEMKKHRDNPIFRVMSAAAYAAPLMRPLQTRSYCIYVWANTQSGKTAAWRAALSIYGNPSDIGITCNSTQYALEQRATMLCDLPLGLDERQLAGKSDSQGTMEQIVYLLGNGISRARGKKSGGIQAQRTWRTFVVITGEQPLIQSSTKDGVASRLIELYGPPIANNEAAITLHQCIDNNYGWAGAIYIGKLVQAGDTAIRTGYEAFCKRLQDTFEIEKDGSHRMCVQLLSYADYLASQCIYGESADTAEAGAKAMAEYIIHNMKKNAMPDSNKSAGQRLIEWFEMNRSQFGCGKSTANVIGKCFGTIDDDKQILRLNNTALRECLTSDKAQQWDPKKFTLWMMERGIIDADNRGNPTKVCKIDGKPVRMLVINLAKLQNEAYGKISYLDSESTGFCDALDNDSWGAPPFDNDNDNDLTNAS